MTGAARAWAGFAAAMGLALVLSWDFFGSPLHLGVDEHYMVQTAIRHAGGQGLTVHGDGPGLGGHPILTEERYERLTWFPPAYPLLVSGVIQLGADYDLAVRLINAGMLVIGVAGWVLLAHAALARTLYFWFFIGLLAVAGGLDVNSVGGSHHNTGDDLLWALTPWWLAALLFARQGTGAWDYWSWILAAGALAAFAIGLRWAAVYMVPAGMLALWVRGSGLMPMRTRSGGALAYAVVPVAAYVGLQIMNLLLAGASTNPASEPSGWDLTRLWTLQPFDVIAVNALSLSTLLYKAELLLGWAHGPIGAGLRVALGLAALLLAVAVIIRPPRASGARTSGADLRLLTASAFAVLVAFLFYMTVRHNLVRVDWSYLGEARYYTPLLPALSLFWLSLLDDLRLRGRSSVLAAVVLVVFIGTGIFSRVKTEVGAWGAATAGRSGLETRLRELTDRSDFSVVVARYGLRPLDDERAHVVYRRYPDPDSVGQLEVGREADLWVVEAAQNQNGWWLDPEFWANRFAAMRSRFAMQKVWGSEDGGAAIYHARIRPGD